MATATRIGTGKTVSGSFEDALARVKGAFQAEGFGVITEMNLQKTLDEKIGKRIEPYVIYGMCNPYLASRALEAEPEIGLVLPCNVVVHEHNGQVHVSASDPEALMEMVDNPTLTPIAQEARHKIERAMRLL